MLTEGSTVVGHVRGGLVVLVHVGVEAAISGPSTSSMATRRTPETDPWAAPRSKLGA